MSRSLAGLILALTTCLLTASPPVAAADDGQTLSADDLSQLSLEELLAVRVLTVTKREQLKDEAPAIVSVITARQIRERGYRTVGEALRSVAGLNVLHDGVQHNLGVRGINGGLRAASRVVKLMIDGQPVAFRASDENFLGEELIPIEVVDRIEVVRGPSSALYGANAFLGVVNVVTRAPGDVDSTEISGRVGVVEDAAAYGGSGMTGREVDRWRYLVAVTGSRTDRSGLSPQDLPGESVYSSGGQESEDDIARPWSVFAKLGYDADELGDVIVDFNFQNLDSFGEFQDWGVLTHDNRISVRNWYVRGRYELELVDALEMRLSLAYSEGEPNDSESLQINDLGLGESVLRSVGSTGLDGVLEFELDLGTNDFLIAGFDIQNDEQDLQVYSYVQEDGSLVPTGADLGAKTFRDIGLYLQAVVRPFRMMEMPGTEFLDAFALTAGLRFDDHNVYEDQITYKLAGVYPFTDSLYGKLLWGTSFRAPAPDQLFTTLIVPGGVIGNPGLDPETARTLELALGGHFLDGHLDVQLVGFYMVVEDLVELVRTPGNVRNIVARNLSEIESRGIEGELAYRDGPLDAFASVSVAESILTKQDPIRGEFKVDTRLYPAWMAKVGVGYALPDLFVNLYAEGRYVGERRASEQNIATRDPIDLLDAYDLDDYIEVDLALTTIEVEIFDERETVFGVKVWNLFDEQFTYPGFRDFDIPGLGRRVMFTLTQTL